MPHRGVDFHCVQAECAVATDGHDLAAGERERRRIRERHADTETCEGPRVEIGRRREAEAREAQDIAAVGDADGIVAQQLAQRREDAIRMHAPVVTRRRRGEGCEITLGSLDVLAAEALAPLGIQRLRAVADGVRKCRQCGTDIAGDLDFTRSIVRPLARVLGDSHETGGGKCRRRTVAELVIEPATDGEYEICVPHRGSTHGADVSGMIHADETARLLRVEVERAARIEQRDERIRCTGGAAAADDERSLRRAQQLGDRLDGKRIGPCARRRAAGQVFRQRRGIRDGRAQHVGWNLDIHRARCAV